MSRRRLPKGKRRGNCLSANRTLIRMLQVRIKRFVSTQVPTYISYNTQKAPASCTTSLSYVNLNQRSLSCCSFEVYFSKASAKVALFLEPPKLFREKFQERCIFSSFRTKKSPPKEATPYYITHVRASIPLSTGNATFYKQ